MLTELFELVFPECNSIDTLAFCSAWHFHHIYPRYQTEDTVLTATLHALQLSTEMEVILMMRFGTSQCPNMSSLSLLEFGTEVTTQKQIAVKSSWYLYFTGRLLSLRYLEWTAMSSGNTFSNDSSFVPTSCGARTMILCAWPYMHKHAHTHTCPPEKLCSLAHLYYMEQTSMWCSSADTCTWARITKVSHAGELRSEDTQWIACCDPTLGHECPTVMIWYCSSNKFSKKNP